MRARIDYELNAARSTQDPWPNLERAHILSQPWAWPHVKVHGAMLVSAVRTRNGREVRGQIIRLIVAGPGSIAGRYPSGNSGRTTMPLNATAKIPDDLATLLKLHGIP